MPREAEEEKRYFAVARPTENDEDGDATSPIVRSSSPSISLIRFGSSAVAVGKTKEATRNAAVLAAKGEHTLTCKVVRRANE